MPPRFRIIPIVAAIASVATTTLAARQTETDVSARVDRVFERFDAEHSPGAAVLVVREGEVLFRKGYGRANIEHEVPVTSATVFDIASVSKQFAGFAIATLVEQGLIGLEDDIHKHLPELPDFGETITVDHLVHHTSGIRDWPGTLAVAGWRMDDVISFDQILTMARHQQDLNFTPGAEYSYSNTGYNILAALVERVTGRTFRQWTDENIFQPLGMTHTHFQDDHAETVPNRARGYQPVEGGHRNAPNGLTALGSSSLFTSADDLAKWVMNFDDGRVGGKAVIDRMRQRGVLNDGERIAYAFGQSVGQYRGLETWSHSGSWAGFRTYLLRVPEHRFGVVILSNAGNYNPAGAARALTDIYLEQPGPPEEDSEERGADSEVTVPGNLLDEYVGTYRLGVGWLVTITRDGDQLITQATNEDRVPMNAVSLSRFFVPAYGASITFGRNASGDVDHATYRAIRAPRVEPYTATTAELEEYEGEFYSEELATSYWITVRDGELVANHRRHGDIRLIPSLRDEFRGDQWFFQGVEFDRDANGAVTGLRVSNGRSRNLRFKAVGR